MIASLYCCLLPLRLARWYETEKGLWVLITHCILGHLVVANLVVHFWRGVRLDAGLVPRPLDIYVPRTMCSHCQIPRPFRAHHCSVCGKCVSRMDHHCPWLNNCVGLNTHRHFFLFLVYLWIGIIYLYCVAYADFMQHSKDVQNSGPFVAWNTIGKVSNIRLKSSALS